MKVCAISFKECWRDTSGTWLTDGGFPRQMAGIASLFDEMDLVVVEVPARAGGSPLPSAARVFPIRKPHGVDGRRKLSIAMRLPYYAGVLIRRILDADVVHVPLPGDIPLLGMIFALLCRRRLIARYGGSWRITSETTLMNRVTRGCMRTFAGGRNVMLATGSGPVDPAPQVAWIFSTALTREEVMAVRTDLSRGLSSPPRFIFAGRLSEEKGLLHLIAAMKILKADPSIPLPHITLAGDGPQRLALEDAAGEAGLTDSFTFAGQLNRTRLSEEMSKADVAIQPSLTEGFSKAWLDAMAHGLPVIASNVGAADTVIGANNERGWLVEPGNVPMLTATMRTVLTSEIDWTRLRRAARRHAESLTLESWQSEIARVCSKQWNIPVCEGRLAG
ncbi:MAG: glycosyltransferase [Bryobacteraceae bacterium]|nr:glycosyltransferase [Bryobacteraceae bacterium]